MAFASAGASVAINARSERPELTETLATIEAAAVRRSRCLATPEQFDHYMRAEFGKWGTLVRETGMSLTE